MCEDRLLAVIGSLVEVDDDVFSGDLTHEAGVQ